MSNALEELEILCEFTFGVQFLEVYFVYYLASYLASYFVIPTICKYSAKEHRVQSNRRIRRLTSLDILGALETGGTFLVERK